MAFKNQLKPIVETLITPEIRNSMTKVLFENAHYLVRVVPIVVAENSVSFNITVVKKLHKKSLYKADLIAFRNASKKVLDIAEAFGMSPSYVSALTRNV